MILLGLVHIAVSSLVALLLCLLFGHLTAAIAIISLLSGWLCGVFAKGRLRSAAPDFRWRSWHAGMDGWIERIAFAFILYVCFRHFAFLFYLTGSTYKALDVSNYGDLPLHIDYIRAMSMGNAFPLLNPSFSHDLLRYPYGLDLYNALWDILGVPLSSHLFVVGIFGSVATLVALRSVSSWWGVIGFFLSGGWIGWMAGAAGIADKVEWKNLFLTVFVTQRGFLFALPVGLLVLSQLLAKAETKRIATFWTGLLWGSLAFFHIHTFVAVSLLVALLAVARKQWQPAIRAGFVAAPIAVGFVLFSTHFLQRASILRWQIGWTHQDSTTLFEFLHFNFGPYLWLYAVLFVVAVIALIRKKDTILVKDFFIYSGVFVLFFNLMLAPWAWDNIKVLIWPYIGLLGLAWIWLGPKLPSYAKPLIAGILSLSGVAVIAPTLTSTLQAPTIFDVGALANCEGATRDIPRSAVFIAANTHLHPLNYFGRNRVLGYPGHIWSHGIDSRDEQDLQDRILRDDPDWRNLAHQLGATHIYWGPDERQAFGSTPRVWMKSLKNISPVESVSVYEIK